MDVWSARQCSDAKTHALQQTKLPLYLANRSSIVVHIHVGKMGGRSMIGSFPSIARMPRCMFGYQSIDHYPWSTFEDSASGMQLLESRCANTDDGPCFFSWAGDWAAQKAACKKAPGNRSPFWITILRDPMSWTFSAMAHYKVTAEQIRAGTATWFGLTHPLNVLGRPDRRSNTSITLFSAVRTALDNLHNSAFGILEDMPASYLVILWQLNMHERARQWCNTSSVEATHTNTKATSTNIGLQSYDTAQWLASRPALSAYRCVYSIASTIFYTRLHQARLELCVS